MQFKMWVISINIHALKHLLLIWGWMTVHNAPLHHPPISNRSWPRAIDHNSVKIVAIHTFQNSYIKVIDFFEEIILEMQPNPVKSLTINADAHFVDIRREPLKNVLNDGYTDDWYIQTFFYFILAHTHCPKCNCCRG